jgi:hypothetical protein
MTRTDHLRRAASVVLVVLAILAVPAVASAKFSGGRDSGLVTGTDRMETPTGITGTYRCARSGGTESVSVTVTTFTDTGPSGASYGYSLLLGNTVKSTVSTSSRSATLDSSQSNDGASTTWTVAIQSYLNRWSSEAGTVSVSCPASGTRTGSL